MERKCFVPIISLRSLWPLRTRQLARQLFHRLRRSALQVDSEPSSFFLDFQQLLPRFCISRGSRLPLLHRYIPIEQGGVGGEEGGGGGRL